MLNKEGLLDLDQEYWNILEHAGYSRGRCMDDDREAVEAVEYIRGVQVAGADGLNGPFIYYNDCVDFYEHNRRNVEYFATHELPQEEVWVECGERYESPLDLIENPKFIIYYIVVAYVAARFSEIDVDSLLEEEEDE